jgi:peroxiredoxin
MRIPSKPRTVGAAVAVLALLLTGCSALRKLHGTGKNTASGPQLAPDFTLTDHTGKPVKLSDFRGKVVLLNFWATWCGPCKAEIPWFVEFQQQYRNRDLVVLGVSFDEDGWTSVRPYMQEKKMNYRVMIGNDEVAQLYGGVEALPFTVIIGRDGRIASSHTGLVSKSKYQTEIEELLDGKKA